MVYHASDSRYRRLCGIWFKTVGDSSLMTEPPGDVGISPRLLERFYHTGSVAAARLPMYEATAKKMIEAPSWEVKRCIDIAG